MENKTENKFGNFLNFMKKFLAMSFFCAVAAFGFGASNTWADASTTPESSFVDKASVTGIEADDSTINKLDNVYYKIGSNNEAEAVKMADESKANATIYGNFNYKTSSSSMDNTGTPASLTAIDAGLLNGKLKNLTIENYPEGGITVNGTVTQGNELDTLTAVSSDGNKVEAAKNDSELLKLVGNDSNKINPNEETPPTAGDTNTEGSGSTSGTDNGGGTGNGGTATGDSGTNTSGTDNGGTGNGDTATGSNGNNGTNTSGTDNGGAGNGGTATGGSGSNGSDSSSGTGNGSGSSESGSGNESNGNNPGTETGDNLTPANVTSTSELEYESGKTTWGELLVKAGVNTSKNDGATGVWKVTAGSTSSGTIIDYKTDKGDLALIPIMESGLESVTFNYEHGENDKFSDSGNIVISLKDISEDVDEEKFGGKKTFGSHAFYVNNDTGETSAIISSEKDKITWLRESSDGTEAWYGFNNNSSGNSEAALEDGSIVSVNWISREKNPAEFDKKVLEATKGAGLQSLNLSVEDDNIWIFELNAYKKVQGADGKVTWEKVEKSDFKDKMEVYIEIGDDWDINDIDALWLDNQEQLSAPEIVNEKIDGVEKRFAVLKLDHFSNYLIYDKKTVKDIIEKLQNIGYEEKLKYAKDHPEASEEELDEIAKQAVADAYNNLSKEDREQLDNFLTATDQSQNQDTVPDADKNDSTSNSSSSSSSGSSKTSSSSGSSWSSSSNDSGWSSGSSSSSNYGNSSYTASSGTKTGKNENLSALLFLLSTSSILSLNSIKRKKYFN